MLIGELERRARHALPLDVYEYFTCGAGEERTLEAQEAAWTALGLRPRILRDVSAVSTRTTVLGTPIAAPVMVAPTAAHALADPQGEISTAKGTRAAGSLLVLSMRASARLDDVAAESGAYWQQVYVLRDRGISDEVARRAAHAGAVALVLTVDTPYVAHKRVGFPAGMPTTGIIPDLDNRDPTDDRLQQAANVTGADISRLSALTGLPVVCKGVLRGDEALRCLEAGAIAVIVSTHGGRQLDGVVPVTRALPEVVDAVGGRAEVYVDGGLRNGIDVVRALALGARAVLLGRPVLWALATGGAGGVERLLTDITEDTRHALGLAGCVDPADAGPDLVAVDR